ncbi:hypothetical protein [Bacillus bingmayongensis]|uniref:hypothetical protein n=1 Tax=Bacillus bingmayongensis TaxID=1150157 RepID=UPI0002F83F6F|nr:hypothetical protein [Bacillus bingmayongensis]
MNKGDAILRLLMEMKLELKEVKEQVEQMHTWGTETIQGMRGHSGIKLQFQNLNKIRK